MEKEPPKNNNSEPDPKPSESYTSKMLSMSRSASDNLEIMHDVHASLDKQRDRLQTTGVVYDHLTGRVSKSGSLNNQLVTVHKRNVMMVYGSFYLLLAVCAWICLRRLGVVAVANKILGIFHFFISKIFGLLGLSYESFMSLNAESGGLVQEIASGDL